MFSRIAFHSLKGLQPKIGLFSSFLTYYVDSKKGTETFLLGSTVCIYTYVHTYVHLKCIYIIWLHQVLDAACRTCLVSCGFIRCVTYHLLLRLMGSLVVVHD